MEISEPLETKPNDGSAYQLARDRFNQTATVSRYPSRFRPNNRRDQMELRCILKTLQYVPAGSHILDLPCGSGRLTRVLLEQRLKVTAADSSPGMVTRTRESIALTTTDQTSRLQFQVSDVLQTGCETGQFDAVICNRLFHHFTDTETRQAAMAELRRISTGPVIISFFNTFSLSATARRIKNRLRRRVQTDRIPVSMKQFQSELRASGLKILASHAVRWGRSPHWYVVAEPVPLATGK